MFAFPKKLPQNNPTKPTSKPKPVLKRRPSSANRKTTEKSLPPIEQRPPSPKTIHVIDDEVVAIPVKRNKLPLQLPGKSKLELSPRDMFYEIFSFLQPKEIYTIVPLVSKSMKKEALHEYIWNPIITQRKVILSSFEERLNQIMSGALSANDAISQLSLPALTELSALAQPPPRVIPIIYIVGILLGEIKFLTKQKASDPYKLPDWKVLKEMLQTKQKLLEKMRTYNNSLTNPSSNSKKRRQTISPKAMTYIAKALSGQIPEYGELSYHRMAQASMAAATFYIWVDGVYLSLRCYDEMKEYREAKNVILIGEKIVKNLE